MADFAAMANAGEVGRTHANRGVLKSCAILGAFFFAAAALAYAYSLNLAGPTPRDGSTLVVGRDFLNFWMYGRAAWLPDPGHWYDPVAYARALATFAGDGYPGQNWSYPPTIMLVAAPFGLLPYLGALLLWIAIGLTVFAILARRLFGEGKPFVAALCAPAALFCLISGQSSLITAAMLIGIFALLDRKPLVAGVLLGLLTLKPQLGVLFPLLLLASGRWRVFAAATVTTVALVGISVALFGVQSWVAFLTQGLPVQNIVLSDPEGIATPFYPTIFMNLRGLGIGYGAAMAVQIAAALAAAGIVAWAFRMRSDADPRLLMALFFACSIAAVPYLLSYDTLALCLGTLALLTSDELDAPGRVLARLVYWLPLLQVGLGTLHVPGPALIAPAMAIYLALRLKNARAGAPASLPGLQRA